MSHFAEREEKKCLNCYTELNGRYCHVCGQENLEPKETVWHLITHFVYDITHFDGKFFTTAKYLLLKPGFLSAEYVKGRRASYLNPIRMYVFISALFFLVFFAFFKPDLNLNEKKKAKSGVKLRAKLQQLNYVLHDTNYSKDRDAQIAVLKKEIDSLTIDSSGKLTVKTPLKTKVNYGQNYQSIEQYDSLQKAKPKEKRDGWLKKAMLRRSIHLKEKYADDTNSLLKNTFEHFFHSFPQMFFISLPLFALVLNLLYIRRKHIYYVAHAIYSIHFYCAVFILMFILLCLSNIDYSLWGILSWIEWGIGIYMFWYLYKSMRNFYQQSRRKTIFKMFLLLILQSFVMTMLFIIFFLASIFSI